MKSKGNLPYRIYVKITFSDGCWEWKAAVEPTGGYGILNVNGRTRKAHKVVYEILVGSVPEGLELDHLCRNRRCVKPGHLEPVTRRENVARGVAPSAVNTAKTHCVHGHPFSGDNLILRSDGGRRCRICRRDGNRRMKARRKAGYYH